MSITDQEQAFLDKIDCKFPHRDTSKAGELIVEARSISPNAAFCVLYEIVCPPASKQVSRNVQRELLDAWIDNATFPLAASIAGLARAVFDGEEVPTEKAIVVMRDVAAIQGQYAALAVVSHLAYQGADEADRNLVDTLEQETRDRWDRGLTPA
jgi:ABC-type nitrate/sulfonate/bicarbonate transport system substrate-binding protein